MFQVGLDGRPRVESDRYTILEFLVVAKEVLVVEVKWLPTERRFILSEKAAPDLRPHAIPVAYTGLNVDHNLESLYCGGRGIKGAFWANYLSNVYVDLAGGEQRLRDGLPGLRIEALRGGGLLIVAAESPLPQDTEENRQRFLSVHRLLQPVFISRNETSERKGRLLGYFYRERPSVVP